MAPLQIDQLMQDTLPGAWKDGQTNALALSVALSTKTGQSVPWTVLRRGIDDAIKSRWIELVSGSSPWPCEMATASAVMLKQPTASGGKPEQPPVSKPKGAYTSSAALEASALQDLVDVLPDIIKVAAGVPLQFQLSVTLGGGQDISSGTVTAINKLLA
jgi:hypothetical protein